MDATFSDLVERFRRLGCHDPEGWARSEIQEGIPQLARFVFLRQLWALVVPRNDRRALNRFAGPNDDGRGGALRRLKDAGASPDDLLIVVREAQSEVVRQAAYLLDQCDEPGQDFVDVKWALYELDSSFDPMRPIGGLHESVDDPDFREQGS